MAVSDSQLTGITDRLDKLLALVDADSSSSAWSKALSYLEDIAAAVGNSVAADGTLEPRRTMRVSLESIYLTDPRQLTGAARYTRSVPTVFVDATTPSENTDNVVPCRNFKAR